MKLKLLSIVLLGTFSVSAQSFNLPSQHKLLAYDCDKCADLEHKTVDYDWSINKAPLKQAKPLVRSSLSYQKRITAKQLLMGTRITTTAPGAVIRITPLSQAKKPADTEYQIITSNNQQMNLQAASSTFASKAMLKENPYFANADLISQLKPSLGKGTFIIKAQNLDAHLNEPFLIDVYDKYSSSSLSINTDKMNYYYDDMLSVNIKLSGEVALFPLKKINAELISPTGDKVKLSLQEQGNHGYTASTRLTSKANSFGENWYVRVDTETLINDEVIYRHATTAFSYALPSASVQRIQASNDEDFAFDAYIEASTESRYALETVLFGSDDAGEIHPLMVEQSGHWLQPGLHKIHFAFDAKKVAKSKYHAPYALGHIRLIDDSQIKPVYSFYEVIPLHQLK